MVFLYRRDGGTSRESVENSMMVSLGENSAWSVDH